MPSLFLWKTEDVLAGRALLIDLCLAVFDPVLLPFEKLSDFGGHLQVFCVLRLPFVYIT